MSNLPLDSRAFRQRIVAGLLTFVLSFLALIGGVVYFLAVHAGSQNWPDLAHVALHLAFWSLVMALAMTSLVVTVADHIHHRLGWHRCAQCGWVLPRRNSPCTCDPQRAKMVHAARRRRWHVMRHYTRRLPRVLLAYLLLVPLTLWLWSFAPARGTSPLIAELAIAHFLICALIAIGMHGIELVLEIRHVARGLRIRIGVFKRVFVIWPLLGGAVMLLRELLR